MQDLILFDSMIIPTAFSRIHGSVENYPITKKKHANLGDTPLFHFHHDYGRKGPGSDPVSLGPPPKKKTPPRHQAPNADLTDRLSVDGGVGGWQFCDCDLFWDSYISDPFNFQRLER